MTRIAVVVLDTLRKDAFDNHFDWLPGRRFENAWATSHWTVPVHGSLFTGKYPTEHGSIAGSEVLDFGDNTLPEILLNRGFTTRGFSANPFITPTFDFDRGFEIFNGPFSNLPMFDNVLDWHSFHEKHKNKGYSRFARAIIDCLREDVDTIRSLRIGLRLKLQDYQNQVNKDSGIKEAIDWFKKQRIGDEKEFVFLI